MCCDEPTVPANWPFTSTAPVTARRRSRRCSPRPTPPRRSHRVRRSDTSSAPSSCGIRSANALRRSIAGIACGRPPTSPPRRSATSEQCNWRAPRSTAVRLHSVQRGATSGSAATCGPPVGCRRAASSSRRQPRMLSDDDGTAAAAVFAGLGQAELMAGNDSTAEGWCAKVFDLRPDRRRQPVGMGYGATRAGHRPQQPGRPGRSGRTLPCVRCRGSRARKVARWPRCTSASHSATPVTTRPRSTPHSTRSRKGSSPVSTAASGATSTRSPRRR